MTRILTDRAVQASAATGVTLCLLAALAHDHMVLWLVIGIAWAGLTAFAVVRAARGRRH